MTVRGSFFFLRGLLRRASETHTAGMGNFR